MSAKSENTEADRRGPYVLSSITARGGSKGIPRKNIAPQDDRRTYGWHQEVFYTLPHSVPIQLWAPRFFPSSAENGAIEVCPGSHARGILSSVLAHARLCLKTSAAMC